MGEGCVVFLEKMENYALVSVLELENMEYERTCFFSSGKSTLTVPFVFPLGLRIEYGSVSSPFIVALFIKVVDA